MTRSILLVLPIVMVCGLAHAETVYEPGHRTWTNSWVPPHTVDKPDTRYVAPRNQPLETMVEPQKKPQGSPPVSVFTPAPQYDPYYNALNAASRPMNFPKPRTQSETPR
ncbi:MAG: hypothetical protein JO021_20785 [Alphaproteobacteria bacterium]|nr:hypothetical protein [Alphaproteobacteria bacterium]